MIAAALECRVASFVRWVGSRRADGCGLPRDLPPGAERAGTGGSEASRGFRRLCAIREVRGRSSSEQCGACGTPGGPRSFRTSSIRDGPGRHWLLGGELATCSRSRMLVGIARGCQVLGRVASYQARGNGCAVARPHDSGSCGVAGRGRSLLSVGGGAWSFADDADLSVPAAGWTVSGGSLPGGSLLGASPVRGWVRVVPSG